MLNPEKICSEHLAELSTSPVRCSHFTLGNPKKSFFNIIIHILQIIYITSEENKYNNCCSAALAPYGPNFRAAGARQHVNEQRRESLHCATLLSYETHTHTHTPV